MSHTKVKTKYTVEGSYGSIEYKTLYCHHNHSSDITTFFEEDGSIASMCFSEAETGNEKWDAMNRLWYPYKGEWGRSDLKDGVEHYLKINE